MQQAEVRKNVVARKAKLEEKKKEEKKKKGTQERDTDSGSAQGDAAHGTKKSLHIMYWNCRGFPWHAGVGTDELFGAADIIMLG